MKFTKGGNYRIVFDGNPEPLHLASVSQFLSCIHKRRESFDVYTSDSSAPGANWKKRLRIVYSEDCQCGRPYKVDGIEFRFRDSLLDKPKTIEDSIEYAKLPVLCKVCYYSNALERGEWAPKDVKKLLGME